MQKWRGDGGTVELKVENGRVYVILKTDDDDFNTVMWLGPDAAVKMAYELNRCAMKAIREGEK